MTDRRINARISDHAKAQAEVKGWSLHQVWLAHTDPDVTYPSLKYKDQTRCIRGDLVAIVDDKTNKCVTVYLNIEETELRPDQVEKGEVISR